MQACLDNTLSPVDSNSLPLITPERLPSRESTPTWTIRFSRPATPDRNELAGELRGVPKGALRRVFGKLLGTRLWQQHRAAGSTANTASSSQIETPASTTAISDREISSGMLRFLCAEAAATLHERRRLAKSISLTALHSDGESETVRQSLPIAANDANALETAARAAIAGMRSDKFVSLKLDLTAMPAQA